MDLLATESAALYPAERTDLATCWLLTIVMGRRIPDVVVSRAEKARLAADALADRIPTDDASFLATVCR
jgi:hypothetical protein